MLPRRPALTPTGRIDGRVVLLLLYFNVERDGRAMFLLLLYLTPGTTAAIDL